MIYRVLSKILTNKHTNHMKNYILWIALFAITFPSCVPVIDDDPTKGGTVTPETQWKPLSIVNADQSIRVMHATRYEVYFLSNNQLFRANVRDGKLDLLEKRSLRTERGFLASPAIADNLFARAIEGQTGSDATPFIEFHLMRNSSVIKSINPSKFLDTTKNETFAVDKDPTLRRMAFSYDGTKFYLLGTVTPGSKPTLLIFDINLNFQADNFTAFEPIKLNKRVNIPNLSVLQWESLRFIDGNLYIASTDGGFRVTSDGQVKRLFNHWCLDFFQSGAKIYTTGFDNPNFYSSLDNGINWKKELSSPLKYVEVENEKIFHQKQRGLQFGIADSSLFKIKEIVYNSTFLDKPLTYNDITYFNDNYYINVEKQIFYLNGIKTK